MEVISKQNGAELMLTLNGELDHHGAHTAIRQIGLAVEAGMPKHLILDFSRVSFMDSSGIALVIRSRQLMNSINGSVQLWNVPPQAKKVFDAAGISKLAAMIERSRV